MPSASNPCHPGPHIHDQIIPAGLSVTDAAKLLDVGRPALSNLLNGKSALSPDMAARIERAFGANARELMDRQTAYDAALAKIRGAAASTRTFVPPFMQFKASDIEDWAGSIGARSRLSVLLRTLINSTGLHISTSTFPGNDDSERPGWDGYVEAGEATPWIPAGKSGWEFGVNTNVKKKADGDYAKSVAQNSPEERARTTFVFVTPRSWKGKSEWEKNRRAAGEWKDVRVFDASNIEEWLEQSIAAQAWFAHERGVPTQGVLSLDACWKIWVADTSPALSPALFAESTERARQTVEKMLNRGGDPVILTADSREEALAFLSCLLAGDEHERTLFRDRVAVFTESGPLTKLASRSSVFIPVITSRVVEKEFAPFKNDMRSIIVYPGNATTIKPDVSLEPLGHTTFKAALGEMGYGRDDIDRLGHESGRSPTVLRRRLSKLEAIRTPEWASTTATHARDLVPFMLAGAWKADNTTDKEILRLLAHDTPYGELETRIMSLLQLDDSPLWSEGSSRGVVSKIDTLFAIGWTVTNSDLENFFAVADLVLSEDDPSLDIPEDRRWFANKRREISTTLRDGICETVVLLAVHGPSLFRSRLGVDTELKARLLVRSLLSPLSARKLEADSHDLPMYAEASPDEFLSLLEADLRSSEPETLKLMRPAGTGIFERCPRTGLLWALENTAWAPGTLLRTIDILARLASVPLEDNWMNKPGESLQSIFRCWIPQTSAGVDERIAALEYLVKHHPKVAWPICIEQHYGGQQVGSYSHKPRWHPDAHGYGEPVTLGEARKFALAALEFALGWAPHTRETLADLVENLQWLDDGAQSKVWDLIEGWAKSANDEDRAWLREKLRLNTMTRRARVLSKRVPNTPARKAYALLKPNDIVLEHAWLFKTNWVEESVDEIADGELDYQKRDERIRTLRERALKTVMREHGLEGALMLAEGGDAAGVVGWHLSRLLPSTGDLLGAIHSLLFETTRPASNTRQAMVSGLLGGLPEDPFRDALRAAGDRLSASDTLALLTLAPFRKTTWDVVTELGESVSDPYWRSVRPMWWAREEELSTAVECLLAVDRPRAAFAAAGGYLERLQPKLLFRVMSAAPRSVQEAGSYPIEPYLVEQALKRLTESGEVSVEEMAVLEFSYLEALDRRGGSIPNLERQMERYPELFVQAVAFAYRRDDEGEDPESWRAPSEEERSNRAHLAYRLLNMLTHMPGHNHQGDLEADILINWIRCVREGCADLARAAVGDIHMGELLAKSKAGTDGVWPIEPVRDAIEATYSEHLARGVYTGLRNSRGIHWRGEGGEQERELAAKYQSWARALEFSHPRVANIIKSLVRTYENEAMENDTEAKVSKRLLRC
ncbi:MAG: HigA family addiction module antitoxin [Alphaproteobacteria bacterium]